MSTILPTPCSPCALPSPAPSPHACYVKLYFFICCCWCLYLLFLSVVSCFHSKFLVQVANLFSPDDVKLPVDFFQLFFDDATFNSIVDNTNKYARQIIESPEGITWLANHPSSRLHRWPQNGITLQKLKAYLGLTMNMGIIGKKKKINDYWTTTVSQETPFFGKVMPFWEYNLVNRMLHLCDNTQQVQRAQPNFDPWFKVRSILDQINVVSRRHYIPSRNVSIDESLIGMKNRVIYIQYLPQKRHARFGIKKFEVCDCNGYVLHLIMYAGKDLDIQHDDGQAVGVVKLLMNRSNLLNKGFHLYTDNFYTKPALAGYLTDNRTLLTGTVRKNSKGLPNEIKTLNVAVGECKCYRKDNMLVSAFRDKKSKKNPVIVLSTGHNAKMVTKTVRGKEKTKPACIIDYNNYMGGVDISDRIIYHYASERATHRYWKKIFFNFVDISLMNSYILFTTARPDEKKMERKKFVIKVLEDLCRDNLLARQTVQRATPTAAIPQQATHRLFLLPGRKEMNCYVCSKPGARKRSRHWCPRCQVGCHERCEANFQHTDGIGASKKRRAIDD